MPEMIENPLSEKLRGRKVILASGSPRRKKFFEELGIDFEIRLKPIEEVYPPNLNAEEISSYLARLKATPFKEELLENEILITSDTVVWCDGISLAKAANYQKAFHMLEKLSGNWHKVITSVCFTTTTTQKTIDSTTQVKFKTLEKSEIDFYIKTYKPFDKAGAYGIQEWIGAVGIEEIQGSYNNVVGLPTHLVYGVLSEI